MHIGTRTGIRRDKRTGLILSSLLSLIVVGYSLLYFNNTYPISEGWGINYAELMFQGKMPYRDFYYYLPPLNLFIDAIFWKLSFGYLLIFRAWYLAQRVLIYVLVFRLLRKYYNQYYAFLACVLTVFIATGDVYDLIGDYNQTMGLLTVLLTYCAVNFVSFESLRRKLLYMGTAGILLSFLMLNKQTIFLACGIVFFLVLTILCILRRDKNCWRYYLAVAVGFIIPTFILVAYLWFNNALIPFFEQVFLNVDGKGSLTTIIINSIASRTWQPALLCIILLVYALVAFENNDSLPLSAAIALVIGIVLHTYSSCMFFETQNLGRIIASSRSAIVAVFGCSVIYITGLVAMRRVDQKRSLDPNNKPIIVTISALLCLGLMCSVCLYSEPVSNEIYLNSGIFNLIQSVAASLLMLGGLGLLPVLIVKTITASNPNNQTRYEALLYIACGGFSLFYAALMGCGDSLPSSYAFRIIMPFVICLLLNVRMKHASISVIFKSCLIAVCILLSVSCVSQKISCSYSWWGSYMAPRSEKTYTVDIPAMAGIRVSADQKELYETVTHAIEEYSDEDDVVWGYPHIKLFNILTNRYNMDTFIPVLFYDVAADVYVEQEAELLSKNPPEVVVWEDIPYCIEVHEDVFRNGEPLKQRLIISLFETLLPESYEKVSEVGNVAVYIREDVYKAHQDQL